MEENQTPPVQQSTSPSSISGQNLVKKVSLAKFSTNLPIVIGSVLVVVAGVITGWFLSGGIKGKKQGEAKVPVSVQTEKEAGIKDESAFRDSAEGTLRQGGINGEGTHHLEREGGPSQNVYLTSSVIDLSAFEGKRVKVWGETISAAKAGWFMDVGRIKVVE